MAGTFSGNESIPETRDGNVIIREFAEDVLDDELVWHRDKRNRVVIPLECDGWLFQRDNEPPEEMVKGQAISIQAEEFHRIHRGHGRLVVKIIEG